MRGKTCVKIIEAKCQTEMHSIILKDENYITKMQSLCMLAIGVMML
jgi:hypothetical protein